jgi:hypothetical protein
MGSPSTGSNRLESRPPTGSHPRRPRMGEENYLHQTYSTKVAINSRLQDMQRYKGFN